MSRLKTAQIGYYFFLLVPGFGAALLDLIIWLNLTGRTWSERLSTADFHLFMGVFLCSMYLGLTAGKYFWMHWAKETLGITRQEMEKLLYRGSPLFDRSNERAINKLYQ